MDKFDDTNTIPELSNQDKDELVIYYLNVTRCLPNDCKSLNKTALAKLIVAAKEGDIDYCLNLSYTEVRNEFEELARGLGYNLKKRQESRYTLIQNLHEANNVRVAQCNELYPSVLRAAHTHYSILTLQGNYENKSDDWIVNKATELQLRAELKRLSGEAIHGATNKGQLQAAVLNLRREHQVPPPPANSLSEDSMDQMGVQVCII